MPERASGFKKQSEKYSGLLPVQVINNQSAAHNGTAVWHKPTVSAVADRAKRPQTRALRTFSNNFFPLSRPRFMYRAAFAINRNCHRHIFNIKLVDGFHA